MNSTTGRFAFGDPLAQLALPVLGLRWLLALPIRAEVQECGQPALDLGVSARPIYMTPMSLRSAVARLLTVLAVIGLVGGGFFASAKVADAAMAAMAADGMDCCDPPASSTGDCQDTKACPFAAVCSVKCPQAVGSTAQMPLRSSAALKNQATDDMAASGLSVQPLGHPPKA